MSIEPTSAAASSEKSRSKPLLTKIRTAIRKRVVGFVPSFYNFVYGTKIGVGCKIALTAKIDVTHPAGVVIGDYTAVAFRSAILTHDFVRRRHVTTRIGKNCFIGAHSIIMPGVTVGDHCIIGSGAVVLKNVPNGSVVIGNPGVIIERGITTDQWGCRQD